MVSFRAFQQFMEAYDIEWQQQSVENQDWWQPVEGAVDYECNIAENGDGPQNPHVSGRERQQHQRRGRVTTDIRNHGFSLLAPPAGAKVAIFAKTNFLQI